MQESLPLVSVVIPTFNRANIVTNAIESVLNQTYKNTEIIIVDDGSTDNTRELLLTYKDKIRYVNKTNGGASSARNLGIKQARGEYIAFLDSDDIWLPTKIEKQINVIKENNDMGIVITEIEFIGEAGRRNYSRFRRILPYDGFMFEHFLKNPQITCSCILIRKNILDKVGVFDESLNTGEDIDLMLRILSIFKIAVIEEPLVFYLKKSDSLSRRLFTGNRVRVFNKIKSYLPLMNKKIKHIILDNLAKTHFDYAKDLLCGRYTKEAQREIKQSLQNRISLNAILLYGKSILIQCLALFVHQFRDKGKFYAQ